jgi:peptidoglycan/LPS O-acetylase OafA/YrhL
MPYILARRESLYLDILRFLAALTVVVDHASAVFDFRWFGGVGHHAVIVFFVLSGYVISNAAATRETAARVFIVARLARLWSVLTPAMVLTVLCDAVGRALGRFAEPYVLSPIDHPLIRFGAAMSFLSESWVSIQPFSNFAVWSLSIEFWYYMTFAAWTFVRPPRCRRLSVLAALCFLGFKGLLLMPVWLMGVALQKTRAPLAFGPAADILLFLLGALLFSWLVVSGVYGDAQPANARFLGEWLTRHLAEARMFWFDWIAGLALTLHLIGARTVTGWIPLDRIEQPIRWCAGISFAMYLFHMPLLHLLAAFLPKGQAGLGIGLTLAAIVVLGRPIERSKRWWRMALDALVALWWPTGRIVARNATPLA